MQMPSASYYLRRLNTIGIAAEAAFASYRQKPEGNLISRIAATWLSQINSLHTPAAIALSLHDRNGNVLHQRTSGDTRRAAESGDPWYYGFRIDRRSFTGRAYLESGQLTFSGQTASLVAIHLQLDFGATTDSEKAVEVFEACKLLCVLVDRAVRARATRSMRSVLHQQLMVKDLKPSSFYYNLLAAASELVPHDVVSFILRLDERKCTGVVVAEKVYTSSRSPAQRIGIYIPLEDSVLQALASLSEATPLRSELASAVLGANLAEYARLVLAVPLCVAAPASEREVSAELLIVASSKTAASVEVDCRNLEWLAAEVRPILANTLLFGERAEREAQELDSHLGAHTEIDEMLDATSRWLRDRVLAADVIASVWTERLDSSSEASQVAIGATSRLAAGSAELLRQAVDGARAHPEHGTIELSLTEWQNVATKLGMRRPEAGSALAVFGGTQDTARACILCVFSQPRRLSRYDRLRLREFAGKMASAARIRFQARRQTTQLKSILEMMQDFALETSEQMLLVKLVQHTRSLLECDYAFVSTPNDLGTKLTTRSWSWDESFRVPDIDITGKPGDGITSHVAWNLLREPYVANDVDNDPFFTSVVSGGSDDVSIGSEMAAALLETDKLIGVLDVMARAKGAFGEVQRTLLKLFLSSAKLAISRAQSARLTESHDALTHLIRTGLAGLQEPKEIYQLVLDTAIKAVQLRHGDTVVVGNLLVRRLGQPYMEVKAIRGNTTEQYARVQYVGEGVVGKVAQSGAPMLVRNTAEPEDGVVYREFLEGVLGGSEIAVPTLIGQEVVSVINVETPISGLFDEHDVLRLESLAAEFSVGIRIAQLIDDELRRAAELRRAHEDRFFKFLSHEVMGASKAIGGLVALVEDDERLSPESRERLHTIRQHVEHTQRLEKDILGILSSKPRLIDALESLRLVVAAHSTELGPSFTMDEEVEEHFVEANETALEFVYWNILKNAIEATSPDTRVIRVRVRSAPDGTGVMIFFGDNGHGIPVKDQESIWEPYFSADRNGRRKGQGLGLWAVRDIMRTLSGNVELEYSDSNKGTQFRITLPAARP